MKKIGVLVFLIGLGVLLFLFFAPFLKPEEKPPFDLGAFCEKEGFECEEKNGSLIFECHGAEISTKINADLKTIADFNKKWCEDLKKSLEDTRNKGEVGIEGPTQPSAVHVGD
jgi:hypothetical protein